MSTTRCAIYTRKSSEEGLGQAFNTLDAQRQAALDYIASQRHQDWRALDTRYDDGGHSGGTLQRPALQRLLADLDAGRVDLVVVYKVDRLSRSLADFARLMQRFDAKGVSFVSVTQQFSTTTSMGRLTLNMLLSFAQFERDIAGERIRDKIAATKKQGIWVCGQPPLGYRLPCQGEDRRLYVVDAEAAIVRRIVGEYLDCGSPITIAQQLNATGCTTRLWTSSRGRTHGGKPLDPKFIHRLLTNPVYIGKITHTLRDGTTEVYQGKHEPILDDVTWQRVQERMHKAARATEHRWTHTHLLKGKLRTHHGDAMSPASVQRPQAKPGGDPHRIIRYYTSQRAIKHGFAACDIKTINAQHLDDLARALVIDHLHRTHALDLRSREPTERDHAVRAALQRVTLAPDRLTLELDDAAIDQMADGLKAARSPHAPARGASPVPSCRFTPTLETSGTRTTLILDIAIKRLDGRRLLLSPQGRDLLTTVDPAGEPVPDQRLVRAVAQATAFHRQLLAGITRADIARSAHCTPANINRLLPLARLGPPVLKALLNAALPKRTTLTDLKQAARHLDWQRQAQHLSISD